MATTDVHMRDHFADLDRQTHAAQLGMWLVIAGDVLLFGTLFVLYASYRADHAAEFRAAAAHADLALGTINTYLLICSSFLVALAVRAVRLGDRLRQTVALLLGAAALGASFLALKAIEYAHHFAEGIYPGKYYAFAELPASGARIFFTLYYFMTGLHALHVLGGIGLLLWLARGARARRYGPAWHTPVELVGMYWHFVDIVWVFLWPIFYLLRP